MASRQPLPPTASFLPWASAHPGTLYPPGPRPRVPLPSLPGPSGPAPGGRSQSESLAPAGSDVPRPAAAGFKLPEEAPAPKGVTGQTRALRFASGAGWLRGGDRGGWRGGQDPQP